MGFFKKYLQAVYYLWAGVYDSVLDRLFHFNRQKVVDALGVRKGEKVLEVGVGTGLNLPYYPKDCAVYGIDMSKAMLRKAEQKKFRARVVFKQMDASKLTFKSRLFDKALMTYVLRVTPRPSLVLKEVARVLKPKGELVVLDQFKTGRPSLLQPFTILLGWGKQHDLNKLLKGVPFKIKSRKQFGKMKETQLVVLEKR
jgi:phosphatidylethanolamine/phosphatidyl-N-methylethanolamine N-methyltransferase